MTWAADILAAKAEDKVTLILAMVVVAISIVASIAQKIMKKRQEQEAGGPARPGDAAGPPPRLVQRPERITAQEARFLRQTLGLSEEELRARLSGAGGAAQAATLLQPDRRAGPPAAPGRQPRRRRPAPSGQPSLARPASADVKAGAADRAPSGPERPADAPSVTVRLTDSRRAREAIVHHEVFSRPKALREGPEMWDL